MGFETPKINQEKPKTQLPDKDKPGLDKLKSNLKKFAGLAALGATLLTTDGCSPDKDANLTKDNQSAGNEKDSSRQNRRMIERKKEVERNKKVNGMILENARAAMAGKINFTGNPFLQMYYQCINDGGYVGAGYERIFKEGVNMRILEIADKHGIKLDLSEGYKCNYSSKGRVPVSAEINGVSIPIGQADYTPNEIRMIDFANRALGQEIGAPEQKNLENQKPNSNNGVRTSPDFEKNGSF